MIGESGDLAGETSNRPFAGLLSAAFVSVFGTAMSAVAIPWLVLSQTGSPGKTGLVSFAELAPYVALQALGGPVVDRVGAARASLFGNVAAAIAMSAIPAAYAAGLSGLGALVPLVALAGASRGIADCGNIVLVPATAALGGIPLQRATGLFATVNSAGLLLGAPVAGVLAASAGPKAVILGDGIAFAAAAVLRAVFLPSAVLNADAGSGADGTAPPESRPGIRGYLEDLNEGLRFIRGDRLLVAIAGMVAATNLLDQGLFAVLLPAWVRDHSYSSATLGLLTGLLSAGMLLGALAASWLGASLPRRLAYSVGFLLSGAPSFAVLAASNGALPVAVVFVACGIAGGAINPILGAVQYERVPARQQARVLGAVKACAWAGMPLGSALAGGLASTAGLQATLAAAAAAFLILTLTPFLFPAWRQLDNAQAPPAEVHTHGNAAH